MDRLTDQQQKVERQKRIPLRTQKTLAEMIRRRYAELCDFPPPPRRVQPAPAPAPVLNTVEETEEV